MTPQSIKFRLVGWYAGLLACVFLLLCTLFYLDLRSILENDLRQAQTRRAHQLTSAILAHAKQIGEPAVIHEIKEWYAPESNGRFIRVSRTDGTLLYRSDAPKDGSFDPAQVPPFRLPPGADFLRKEKLADGHTLLIASLDFNPASGPEYSGWNSAPWSTRWRTC